MIAEANFARQVTNSKDGRSSERLRCIRPFKQFDDDRQYQMQILFDIRPEHVECLQNTQQRRLTLARDLAIERLKHIGQQDGQIRLELAFERFCHSFNERDDGKLDARVGVPVLLHQLKDRLEVAANVLLDDRDEDGQLLEVEFRKTSAASTNDVEEGWNDLWQEGDTFETLCLEHVHDGLNDGVVVRRKRRILEDGDEGINGDVLVVVVRRGTDGESKLEQIGTASFGSLVLTFVAVLFEQLVSVRVQRTKDTHNSDGLTTDGLGLLGLEDLDHRSEQIPIREIRIDYMASVGSDETKRLERRISLCCRRAGCGARKLVNSQTHELVDIWGEVLTADLGQLTEALHDSCCDSDTGIVGFR